MRAWRSWGDGPVPAPSRREQWPAQLEQPPADARADEQHARQRINA